MDKQSIQVAQDFHKRIKKKFKFNKLILFGSRARGDNLKNSDFDFIIISKEFENKPFFLRPSEFFDYWKLNVDLEIICYTPQEFEKKKNQIGIVQQAFKEGIEIK